MKQAEYDVLAGLTLEMRVTESLIAEILDRYKKANKQLRDLVLNAKIEDGK